MLTTVLALWTALAVPPTINQLDGAWTKPAVPLLANDAAWKALPPTTTPRGGPLPSWARMLAHALPNTTAAMLEFDRVHRLESPLDRRLRARLRWQIADANRCEYTRQTALADLKYSKISTIEAAALERRDASVFERLPADE